MKKVLVVFISILFLVAIVILVKYYLDYNSDKDRQINKVSENLVDLVDRKGNRNIKVGDVDISDILIEDKKVKFNIESEKINLSEKSLVVAMLNDDAVNSEYTVNIDLQDALNESGNTEHKMKIEIDMGEHYNNPNKIDFNFE